MDEFEKRLFDAVWATKDKMAILSVGSHCHFCPAIAVCPQYRYRCISLANHPLVAENFRIAQYLGKWQKAISRVAYRALMSNEKLPGLKLVQKNAHRKWKDEKGLAKQLVGNSKAFKPSVLKSPAQLEKIISKDFVKEHAFKPEGGLSVAIDEDKRPAMSKALHDFSDVEVDTE